MKGGVMSDYNISRDQLILIAIMEYGDTHDKDSITTLLKLRKDQLEIQINKLIKLNLIIEDQGSFYLVTARINEILSSSPSKILSINDLFMIGYLSLFGEATLQNIQDDLGIEQDTLYRSALVLRLLDYITLSSINLETIDQEKISLNNSKRLFIDFNSNKLELNFEDKFLESDIDLSSLRLLAGYLQLRAEIPNLRTLQKELHYEFSLNFSKLVTRNLIFRSLCLISLDTNVDLKITPQAGIICKGITQINLPEKTLIPGYDSVNLDVLIGWLSLHRIVSLSSILDYLNSQTSDKLQEFEVLEILSSLARDGIIEGKLDDDKTLYISTIRKGSQSVYLIRDERILLGFLQSDSKKKISSLASMLGVSKNEVLNLISQFIARSNIGIEIARDGSLISTHMGLIPLSTQTILLPNHLLEPLGFVANKNEVKLNQINTIWDIEENSVRLLLTELVGYGLIRGKFINDIFKISSIHGIKSNYKPTITQELDHLVQKLEEIIELKINIEKLSTIIDLQPKLIIRQICGLIAQGIYPHGIINFEYFIKNGEAKIQLQYSSCLNCGQKLRYEEAKCSNCHLERDYCLICKGLLIKKEKINSCPNCMQKGHKDHFMDWLLIRSECPSCRTIIEVHQLE